MSTTGIGPETGGAITPITIQNSYPEIKKILWRYGRIFVDGLLGALTIEVIQKAVGMEYNESIKYVVWAIFAGGFAALSKVLRNKSDDYGDSIHKLPL